MHHPIAPMTPRRTGRAILGYNPGIRVVAENLHPLAAPPGEAVEMNMSTSKKLTIGLKLSTLSVLTNLMAPVAYPWMAYRSARMFQATRPVAMVAAVGGALVVPWAPLSLMLTPLSVAVSFATPWVPGIEEGIQLGQKNGGMVHRWIYR